MGSAEYASRRRTILKALPVEARQPAFKKCNLCNTVKPAADFGVNRTSATGLQSLCKVCGFEKMKLRNNRLKVASKNTIPDEGLLDSEKECANCHKLKPRREFHQHYTSTDGRRSYCKSCEAKKAKHRKLKNKKKWASTVLSDDYLDSEKEGKKCHKVMPRSEFWADFNTTDGRYGYCKTCSKEYQQKNKKKWESTVFSEDYLDSKKECAKCHEFKMLREFSVQRCNSDGRHSYCKTCWNDYQRLRRQKLDAIAQVV